MFSASTTDNEQKSLEYLRYELPTRLANMLKEIHRLPAELLETPSFSKVKKMYEETLDEVLVFEKSDPQNIGVREDFIECLSGIVNRHRSVVEQVNVENIAHINDSVNSQAVGVRYCLGCQNGLVSPICLFLTRLSSRLKFFALDKNKICCFLESKR